MTSTSSAIAAAITVLMLTAGAQAQGRDPTGVWLTKDRDAVIRVDDCGGALCGEVAWLAQPNDKATGKPLTDRANADPSKRSRPLIGTPIILGMRPAGANKWTGAIYNADDGKTYKGSITVLGPSTLRIEGCLAVFCGSQDWKRTNQIN